MITTTTRVDTQTFEQNGSSFEEISVHYKVVCHYVFKVFKVFKVFNKYVETNYYIIFFRFTPKR